LHTRATGGFFHLTTHSEQKKRWFNGSHETQRGTKGITGLEVLNVVKNVENDWGKGGKKRKKKNTDATQPWKKKLIFFNLSY